jgi:HK97 family phage portal protein
MLDRLRETLAIWAARIVGEPRYPDWDRVPANLRTLAGTRMDPDEAVTISAVWACLRYLSQTVSVLPWHVMRDGSNGPEIWSSHPIERLLYKRASREWSSAQFRETLTHWALRWGNGYAEIEFDQLGRAFALWPIHPERVQVCRNQDNGELYYEVSNSANGAKIELAYGQMFHIRGFGEGPVGVNVVQYAAQSLGWAKAAQLFGAAFFGNGATPATVVINKKPLTPAGLARQKEQFNAIYKGPQKSNKTAFVDQDAEIKTIGNNAAESQIVEVHQHLVEEICRWFGVPPHKVMHLLRSTFNNIEHQAIEVVVDSVSPWVKRFEDEAEFKLLGSNRAGAYTKMNMRALMRGDAKARGEFYKTMFNIGAYSPNDVLSLEDENTIGPDGDKRFVPVNMTTLDRAGEEPVEVAQPAPAQPAAAPAADEGDGAVAHARIDAVDEMLRVVCPVPS